MENSTNRYPWARSFVDGWFTNLSKKPSIWSWGKRHDSCFFQNINSKVKGVESSWAEPTEGIKSVGNLTSIWLWDYSGYRSLSFLASKQDEKHHGSSLEANIGGCDCSHLLNTFSNLTGEDHCSMDLTIKKYWLCIFPNNWWSNYQKILGKT